jgi:hypothetical protein
MALSIKKQRSQIGTQNSGDINKFIKDELQEKKHQELRQHERAGSLLGVICALISLRCCWENNSGIKRPDRKVHGKKGEIKNFVFVTGILDHHLSPCSL